MLKFVSNCNLFYCWYRANGARMNGACIAFISDKLGAKAAHIAFISDKISKAEFGWR